MDVRGKSVVVTGAASGIGRASALAYAQNHAEVVHVVDVDGGGLADTVHRIGLRSAETRVRAWEVDLADLDGVEQWLAQLEAEEGYEIFHNNAGAVMASSCAFPEAPVDKIRWIMDLNLMSVIVNTQRAAHYLSQRGGGVIVNTSSIVALEGSPDTLYSTTKAAILMFTRSCEGLKDSMNVRVTGILPGDVDTTALRNACVEGGYLDWLEDALASGMVASPEAIADAVIGLVQNDSLPGGACMVAKRVNGAMVHEMVPGFGV